MLLMPNDDGVETNCQDAVRQKAGRILRSETTCHLRRTTMMTKGAITNLVNRYRSVLKKCNLMNVFGSLAVAGMLVMGGASVAEADQYKALQGQEETISGDIAYNGDDTRIVYAQAYLGSAGTLNFTGDNISLKTNTNNPAGNTIGLSASSFTDKAVPRINIGSADKRTSSFSVDVTNTGFSTAIWAYANSTSQYGGPNASGGEINIYTDTLSVRSHSENDYTYGIFAQNSTTTATGPVATINIDAGQTFIDVTDGDPGKATAIVALSQGKINIDGDLYVNTRGGTGNAVVARGDAAVLINKSGTGTVQMNGNIDFNYHDKSSGTKVDAIVDVTLNGTDSWWNGNASITYGEDKKPADDKLSVSGMLLALNDGATWTPTAIATVDDGGAGTMQAPLNNLSMNDGVVNLNPEVDVQVDKLTGSGTVNMAVDNGQAGSLTAGTAQNASLNVNLTGVTSDDLTAEQAATLVQQVSSDDRSLTVTGNVDEGLVNGALTIGPDGNTSMGKNRVMEAALETASVSSVALDRILTNDLRKRMGDLRSANGEHGLWVRWDGGKLKGDSGLTNNFNTIQIGADTAAGQNVRLGLAASFTHGDIDHSRGSSDMEGVALAGYGVWMAQNGLFADVVGRIGTFRTDMSVDGHDGTLDSLVASLSGEVGWRVDLNELFYLEPQAELAYTYIEGDKFGLGSARYDIDDTDSLIGRAGLAAGFKLPDDRGDIYARASVVQQFMGDAKISGQNNGMLNTYKLDGDDTWVEYGIGSNIRLTDAVYAWIDVERTEGATIDEEWRGTVGLRYSF